MERRESRVARRRPKAENDLMTATGRRAVVVRRIYEDDEGPKGYKVLVDRLWPRGVKRTPELFDEWAKDVAPSTDLRRWYGHDPARFDEFARRYRAELGRPPARDAVEALAAHAEHGGLVLLTATRDVDRSAARVLADVLS